MKLNHPRQSASQRDEIIHINEMHGGRYALAWFCFSDGRDRNAGHPAPLAHIPACATNALGSCLRYERQSVDQGMGESPVF